MPGDESRRPRLAEDVDAGMRMLGLPASEVTGQAGWLAAVAGDEEPELWRLAWTEGLLRALRHGTLDELRRVDPDAYEMALAEAEEMCRLLRAAASPLAADAEGHRGTVL